MNETMQEETAIFELKPTYRAHLGLLVWGVLLAPVGIGLILLARAWYLVASTRYRLTNQPRSRSTQPSNGWRGSIPTN